MFEFRPHHFLCTVGFEGKGYSPEFVANFTEIANHLRDSPEGDDTIIRIVGATDSICSPCPNRRDQLCTSQEKIDLLDHAHAAHLGFHPGQEITWREAKRRIAEKMEEDDFEKICGPCGWRALGICQAALRQLKAAKPKNAGVSGALCILLASALALSSLAYLSPAAFAAKPRPKSTKSQRKPASPALKRKQTQATEKNAAAPLVSTLPAAPTEAPVTPPPAEPSPQDPPTIDSAKANILKHRKSKDAHAVKMVFEAIKNKKFEQARKLAKPLQSNAVYSDYGYKLTADAYLEEAKLKLSSGGFAAAQSLAQKSIDAWLQVRAKNPYSPLLRNSDRQLADAETLLGEAHHGQGHWKNAAQAYERAFQRLAGSNRTLMLVEADVLGHYAETCLKAKSLLCDAWIQRFVSLQPRGSDEFQAIIKQIPSAASKAIPRRSITRLTQTYKAPDLDQATLDQAMELYQKEKYGDSVQAFSRFLDEFPKSVHRFRVRYWLGQALTHQQDHEKARRVHEELLRESPLSYYGLMASISTGIPVEPRIDATLPVASAEDPALLPSETIRLRRAEEFIAENAPELALIELRELRPRDQLSDPFLMYLAALNTEVGNHGTAFSLLQELIQRGYEGIHSTYGVRLIFPTDSYLKEIRKFAAEAQLDPILVMSLVKQESAFDADAMSWAGATGLMQIMPATARDIQSGVKKAELAQANTNLRLGTQYLKKVLDRFNGNIAMALAGYNAGPNAVARWVREGKAKRGILEFIEAIPYKETREYVAAIMRNYYWYSKILTGESPQGIGYFWNMYGPPEQPAVIPVAVEVTTPDPQQVNSTSAEAGSDSEQSPAGAGPAASSIDAPTKGDPTY